jgi:hypothetical protein
VAAGFLANLCLRVPNYGIVSTLADLDTSKVPDSKRYFVSSLRIDFNSCRRFAVVLGYAIFSPLSVSRTIWETINRAFSLSSAGTT